MAHQETTQRQAVKPPRKEQSPKKTGFSWFAFLVLGLAVGFLAFSICFVILDKKNVTISTVEIEEETTEPADSAPAISEIDFQPLVDTWAKAQKGNKSVLIYDLDLDKTVGEYNTDEQYNTASLYKLFVVYEGYRLLESKEWNSSTNLSNGYTILKCLDLAIRESNSPCAESLYAKIGRSNLDQVVKNDFNIQNTDVAKLNSNAKDILAIMKIFYYHTDIKDQALISQAMDSFLNQPATTYDWRQGLPSGFKTANVYNKVGWEYNPKGRYWNIYHDAAIVEFPEQNRHFIVVIMTNRIDFTKIRQFGTEFEKQFLAAN